MASSINKNRFKKTYGYERVTPAFANVLIAGTDQSIIIDRNVIKVDRQFYLLAEPIELFYTPPPTASLGEYEENDYNITIASNTETVTFTTPFSSIPIVVAQTNTSSNNLYNVNLFIDSVSTTNFTVKFSSGFSGSLRYRAIYNPTYPTIVERTPLFPSSYYTASAGFVSLVNESQKTITYPSLGSIPFDLFLSPQDANNDDSAQVAVSLFPNTSIGDTSSTIAVSSPLTNQINFIVVKPPIPLGEYEEDDYDVSSFSESETVTFTTPFSSIPIVVAETNPSSNDLENVNLYVDSISATNFTVRFSSEFSGSIRYRAIYNSTYPAIVERTPLFPSSYYTASAGVVSLLNEDQKVITYPTVGGTPTELFLTAKDANVNDTAQVFVTMSLGTSIGGTSSDISVSAPLSNQINFIVAKV